MSVQDGYPKVFDERTPADENGSVSGGAASDWDWRAFNQDSCSTSNSG